MKNIDVDGKDVCCVLCKEFGQGIYCITFDENAIVCKSFGVLSLSSWSGNRHCYVLSFYYFSPLVIKISVVMID